MTDEQIMQTWYDERFDDEVEDSDIIAFARALLSASEPAVTPTDDEIAHFGHIHSEDHDEPIFTFDRRGFISCVRALLTASPAPIDGQEPVAWYVPDDNGVPYMTTGYCGEALEWKMKGKQVLPLYAAPLDTGASGGGVASELHEAARQFHNLTQGDPYVVISPPTFAKRDAIIEAGDRLRKALQSPAQDADAAPAQLKAPSSLAEQIKRAQAEMATWSPEKRVSVRLEGDDPFLSAAPAQLGFSVARTYAALSPDEQKRTSLENVRDVLRVLNADAAPAQSGDSK